MSYCFNPYCCQPNNQHQSDICSSCGQNLLLKERYRGVKLLGKSQLTLTIEATEIDLIESKVNDCKRKVIKILLTDFNKAIALFQQEAQILAQINHAGIPKLATDGYFSWQLHGRKNCFHCLVINKIPGIDLEQWFKQRNNQPISEPQAKEWLKQILNILAELHNTGYFHRDIKPANLILQPDGKLALIDFGASRKVSATYLGKVGVQQGVTSIGTPGYIAPEQIDGAALPQSDFFSLGRTLIHLLTGKHPQELPKNPDTGEIIWRDLVSISTSFADLLDSMIDRLPGKRPINIVAIINAVNDAPVGVDSSSKLNNKLRLFLLIVFGTILIPGFLLTLFNSKSNSDPQVVADAEAIEPLCYNRTCINRDPIDNKCDLDSQTITSDIGNYQTKPNVLKAYRLEVRYSPNCQAAWARTEAPPGSTHYIEDRQGTKYGSAVVPVDQWERHYADMAPAKDVEIRACAKPPQGQTKCTNFVRL